MNSTSLTVPSTTNFTRATAARIALASAIVAASLWDFRLATLRIFDLVSLVFICGFFALEFDVKRDWFSRRAYILPLVVLFVAYAIYGYVNFDHRSSLAIVLLSLICLQFAGYANASWLARVFRWIVYLNVAAVLLQYFSFRLFGVLLDPNQLLGVTSRIFEGGGGIPYIRAAGLFQEPNSCALNIFMMAAAALGAETRPRAHLCRCRHDADHGIALGDRWRFCARCAQRMEFGHGARQENAESSWHCGSRFLLVSTDISGR